MITFLNFSDKKRSKKLGFTKYINFGNFRFASRQKRDSRSCITGFTLIELLVVIAIIGVLASIVLASLNSARRKARDSRRITDVKQIQLALELYFDSQNNSYPPGSGTCDVTANAFYGLQALVLPATGSGYIPQVPRDPLSGCYRYATPTAVDTQTTYHLGADLEETTNPALNSDKDCSSAGTTCPGGVAYVGGATVNGANEPTASGGNGSNTGCGGTLTNRACYDVIP